jgi:hypothetical protein
MICGMRVRASGAYKLIADSPGKDEGLEKEEGVRARALYDPDTVHRIGSPEPSEKPAPEGTASAPCSPPSEAADETRTPPLYSRRERQRAAGGVPRQMVKQIADRVEMIAARRKARGEDV